MYSTEWCVGSAQSGVGPSHFCCAQEILLEQKQLPEAKDVLEDVIIRHNSGLPLDVNTRKSFHLILWEQAAAAMDVGCGWGCVGEGCVGWVVGGVVWGRAV